MKSLSFIRYISLVIAGAAALAGCASVSVKNMEAGGASFPPAMKPEVIYILPFDTNYGEFNVDREGTELADFKQNLQQMLGAALAAEIPEHLVSAQYVHSLPPRSNAWVVCGRFVRVNQGSRALRSAIGFGAGGTKLEAQVFVYNLADNAPAPFLTFETTGGSNAQPGAIVGAVTLSPVGAALNAVNGSAKGLSEDTRRTARMITAALSDYMFGHGWISEAQRLTPKMAE